MKRLLLLVALLLLLSGCGGEDQVVDPGNPPTREGTGEEAGTATPQSTRVVVGTTILANGQLVAVNPPLALSFKTGGRLLDVHVAAGDQVTTGDLIATLDDEALREALTNAELAVAQAQNSLAQAELSLADLLNWEADDVAVSVAEANLEATEANYEKALDRDAAAGNNLTSARVSLSQAQRALADAQEAYDNAWDEARDWELNYNEPICLPGQGPPIPCTGPTWAERIKNDRNFSERALQNAQEGLSVARANYSLTEAGLSDNSALDAAAAVANAQQVLHQAQTGPKDSQIAAAQLQVEQAELTLSQAEFNLALAQQALENARLEAPWSGTVLSVDAAPGGLVASGVSIVTLLDSETLQFHTGNLSERDLAYIAPEQPVQISLKSYPGQAIDGQVAYIVPQASGQVGDAATFTVVIVLDNTDLELLPGMTGRAEIQRGTD
ncbi:MAG: efflux RND transporter periplasmic adaptor subunit [Chloroflexota bacterium]|nr:MAG: efflux RND transporter periplasmic adaptor subunit [Chloroflexota bacterium]